MICVSGRNQQSFAIEVSSTCVQGSIKTKPCDILFIARDVARVHQSVFASFYTLFSTMTDHAVNIPISQNGRMLSSGKKTALPVCKMWQKPASI